MLIAKNKSLRNALHGTTVFLNYNIMKIGKSNETYQLKTRKQKYQLLIPIPKNNLECQTMKTRVYVEVAEQIEKQEILPVGFFEDLFSIVSKNILMI